VVVVAGARRAGAGSHVQSSEGRLVRSPGTSRGRAVVLFQKPTAHRVGQVFQSEYFHLPVSNGNGACQKMLVYESPISKMSGKGIGQQELL
jgi:hypothetical protein